MISPVQTAPAPDSTLGSRINLLAGVIGSSRYPSGDRASLKRWAPGQPIPLAFYRLWLRHVSEDLPNEAQTEAWMTLAWGLAISGEASHDPKRPLGQALAESGFSEGRLERLLSAPDDVRIELFMSAVRFLAAKGERFDWSEAARFLLAVDAAKRESIHRRIAQAYYRQLSQQAKE
jgi:CRISPR system Cascade subunit CasB